MERKTDQNDFRLLQDTLNAIRRLKNPEKEKIIKVFSRSNPVLI